MPDKIPVGEQLAMYAGVLIGVVFSSAVQQYSVGQTVSTHVTLGVLLVSAVIALVLMPIVFEKLQVHPTSPFLVRFGLFVQNGVFWQVLFTVAGKTVGAAGPYNPS